MLTTHHVMFLQFSVQSQGNLYWTRASNWLLKTIDDTVIALGYRHLELLSGNSHLSIPLKTASREFAVFLDHILLSQYFLWIG